MKTIVAIIIICIFITGCGEKEYKPVRININKDGTFLVDGQLSNKIQLKKYLTDIIAEKGLGLKIIFIADDNALFSVVEPVILASSETYAWWFIFEMGGSIKSETCLSNFVVADGPPARKLNIEIKDNIIFIDNKKSSTAELKNLLSKKPEKKWGYNLYISCSGKTTYGFFYKFVELCNQYDYVSPELQISDKL